MLLCVWLCMCRRKTFQYRFQVFIVFKVRWSHVVPPNQTGMHRKKNTGVEGVWKQFKAVLKGPLVFVNLTPLSGWKSHQALKSYQIKVTVSTLKDCFSSWPKKSIPAIRACVCVFECLFVCVSVNVCGQSLCTRGACVLCNSMYVGWWLSRGKCVCLVYVCVNPRMYMHMTVDMFACICWV